MKLPAIAVIVLSVLSSPAMAAGELDWSGWYAGLGAGYGSTESRTGYNSAWGYEADGYNLEGDGAVVSGFTGYRWIGPSGLMLGAEVDLTWRSYESSGIVDFYNVTTPSQTGHLKQSFTLSAFATAGMPVGRALPYFGIGPTLSAYDWDGRLSGVPFEHSDHMALGAAAILGLDYALTDQVVLRSSLRLHKSFEHDFTSQDPVPLRNYLTGRSFTREVMVGVAVRF